jgi:hypothetical protein
MPATHFYGLKCKNPECGSDIVLGKYQTEAKTAGEMIDIPYVTHPGSRPCRKCGKSYQYGFDELVDLGPAPE